MIQQTIAQHIAQCGFSVMGVMGDNEHPPFAYTVGLTETYDHPEIIVVGLNGNIACPVLWNLIPRIKQGMKLTDGLVMRDIANFPVAIKDISPGMASHYTFQALYYYKGKAQQPKFQQLVLTDAQARFPWDPGYDDHMKKCQIELWQCN